MEIRKSNYTSNLYFVGFDGDVDDAAIEQVLIGEGHDDWEVRTRRSADAADTNTESDLSAFSELFNSYENVDVVTTREPL